MSRCFPKSRKHAVTQGVAGGWAGSCGTSTENPGLSHSHANTGNRSLKLNASLLTCLRQFVILKAIVRDSSTTKIVATLWRI